MRRFHVELTPAAKSLRAGIEEIKKERPPLFSTGGLPVRFERAPRDLADIAVTREGKGLTVRYGTATEAFRALGRILGGDEKDLSQGFRESCLFDMAGIMIDVSRNAVLTVDTVKAILRRIALMGLNTCMLYSEDTYEVPGEPFFGYLRGRYSKAEMKELDRYAANLGIEMFPCIQTLAHLEQILQWPAYAKYRDTSGVLLADEDATYELLEKMIRAASEPFRSKRIHIGMDEAMGIGDGRYRAKFGIVDPFVILNRHLARLNGICKRLGLRPMIWSDMYFRIGSKTHHYYDESCVIPQEVVEKIPDDVQLVYWDYYHVNRDFYEEWIERHRALGSEPIMAGGVWTWNHFWCALDFSFKVTDACMTACKAKGLREAFTTLWGDDGNECDIYSALPGIQHFAEHAWSDKVDMAALPSRFLGSSEADFEAYVRASAIDSFPQMQHYVGDSDDSNVSKWLVYEDPLLAFFDYIVAKLPVKKHYTNIAADLAKAVRKPGGARLAFPAQIAKTIALRYDLRKRLAVAQARGDRPAVRTMVRGDLTALRKEVTKLWKLHRAMWFAQYKPFGWEVIDHRYGGLLARIDTAAERLSAYAAGGAPLPELAVKFHKFTPDQKVLPRFSHARVKTPSCIK